MENKKVIVFCDGGSRGNPGPAASAFVVTEKETVIYKEGKFIGVNTNNIAEYNAVLMAVKWLSKNQEAVTTMESEIVFNLDSQLVERQLNGFYKIKNQNLMNYVLEIKKLISDNKLDIKFTWGYRSNNKLADSLVNEALDQAAKN